MTKADFELKAVSALFRGIPAILQRRWIPSPDPEVDVLVERLDGALIAVEVTRLLPGGGEAFRRWEAAQENVLKMAATIYEGYRLPNVEVVVLWSAWTNPEPKQNATAAELANFVAAHLPAQGDAIGFDSARDDGVHLPRAVAGFEIRRLVDDLSMWHAPRAAFLSDITPQEIEERLAAKNPKPATYQGSYAECWLVLAVGLEDRATWGSIPESLTLHVFQSTFDRVFVASLRHAVELRVVPAV